MKNQGESQQPYSQGEEESIDNHSSRILFGDRTVVQGDVVGGNKYEVRFYAVSSRSASGKISWSSFRQDSQSISEEPYKFLSYYDTLDADIFYGREAASDLLVSKISNHKLVLINGTSGSGKTSLINAGVIPRLTERGYFTIVFRDYGYPTDVIKAGIDSLENVNIDLSDSQTLAEVLQKTHKDTQRPIAIFLDQFERFFLNIDVNRQARFIQEFSECLNSINSQEIAIIISIRRDFFGNLGKFWSASPEFNTESYPYYLESLSRDEALEAIKKPLQQLHPNISYDADFLESQLLPHLLKNTSGSIDLKLDSKVEPVHLQIVCNRLFDEVRTRNPKEIESREPIIIKESLYQELGGVQGILIGYVDSILTQFSSKEREEAKSILKQMVTGQGTRAFRSLSEIKTQLQLSEDEVEKILQQLDRSRLIETIPGEKKYSLTHEYLVQKVNQWYDPRELEIKKAKELFDRCLSDWKTYQLIIPRKQFREIEKFKSNLPIDKAGEELFKWSSLWYYGIKFGSWAIVFLLSASFIDRLIHNFYLIPQEIGRLRVESLKGEDLHQSTEILAIDGKDGSKKKYQVAWGVPYMDGIPKGLYYVEVKYNRYIIKQPVKINGYQNYNLPITLKIPTDKLSKGLVKNMVEIQKGNFVIGHPLDTENLERRTVSLDNFYIDKYEVNRQDYENFLKEIANNDKLYQVFYNDLPSYKKGRFKPGDGYERYSRNSNSPAIFVDWYDAAAYCAWQGKRLPTVLEWEKAATGKDPQQRPIKSSYPWGNDPDPNKANTQNKQLSTWDNRKTEEVNSYENKDSFFPVFNLIGNAAEWTDIWYVESMLNEASTIPYHAKNRQIVKGGSFAQEQKHIVIYINDDYDIYKRDPRFGFRCAISKLDK